jgi:G3E family GTPase
MATPRIPVYLVTGFLGSGKTTLLLHWLRHPLLSDAALIVNEIGEVGFDNQILATAIDSSSLIANACVCCTGLPGLEEALEDLFWARLQKRMPAFGSVVIETTGLADPAPVLAALASVPLLKERYRVAGVIATVGAVAGSKVLAAHEEARSQVSLADVLVITKSDLVDRGDVSSLATELRAGNATALIETSGLPCLEWDAVLQRLATKNNINDPIKIDHDQIDNQKHSSNNFHKNNDPNDLGHYFSDKNIDHAHKSAEEHHHAHDAITSFVVINDAPTPAALHRRLAAVVTELGDTLLRLKGWVALNDGTEASVQLSPAESRIEILPADKATSRNPGRRSGLTIITRGSQLRAALILNSDK